MPEILFEKRDNIAFITLNRPEVLNAMNNALRIQLVEAWDRLREENDIFVAIITGAGDRAFCTGYDLKEMAQRPAGAPTRLVPFLSSGGTIEVWKPIIAAIHGYCVGGGFELALACDIRVAAENAVFGLPEVRATGGIPGQGGPVRLPRLLPMGVALELLFTGDRLSAQEAHRLGLVNRLVPPDQLMPTAEALARKICENNPAAVRAAKMIAHRSLTMHISEGMALAGYVSATNRLSEDSKEYAAARAENRKPVWTGR